MYGWRAAAALIVPGFPVSTLLLAGARISGRSSEPRPTNVLAGAGAPRGRLSIASGVATGRTASAVVVTAPVNAETGTATLLLRTGRLPVNTSPETAVTAPGIRELAYVSCNGFDGTR